MRPLPLSHLFTSADQELSHPLPSHARSQHQIRTQREITLDVLAAEIVSLLDANDGRKAATFIGVSIGSATVLNFALRYPERTESIFCGCIFAKSPQGMRLQWEERIAVGRREGAVSAFGEPILGESLAGLYRKALMEEPWRMQ